MGSEMCIRDRAYFISCMHDVKNKCKKQLVKAVGTIQIVEHSISCQSHPLGHNNCFYLGYANRTLQLMVMVISSLLHMLLRHVVMGGHYAVGMSEGPIKSLEK